MQRTLLAAALTVLTLSAGSTAHALSCGGRFIEMGTSSARVRALCGQPTTVTQSVLQGAQSIGAGPYWLHMRNIIIRSIPIEKWVYDFGPNRFMEELTFANGNLARIRDLGYGTLQGQARLFSAEPRARWALVGPAPAVVTAERRRFA